MNPDYVKSNILPETFASLNLNFIIFSNNAGQVIASYGYDLINNQPTPVPQDFLNLISQNQFFRDPGVDSKSVGYLLINDKPILLAYHPILTGKFLGPPRGSIIMGRYLSKDYITHLSEATQSSIQIEFYEGSALNRELQTAQRVPDIGIPIFIKILSPQSIAGYTVIEDIFGAPVLILRTDMERDIYNQGNDTVLFLFLLYFLAAYSFLSRPFIY